jgi:hypothetical protein
MKRKKNLFIFHFLILFIGTSFSEKILGVVIGSTTAVSIQPVANFPAADLDNTMLGFGWFQNGFTLEDSTTSCTFSSVFPVSGGINLNGGTLYLSTDLLFQNVTTLNGLGSVIADNHSINLCTSVNSFPTDAQLFQNAAITLNTDLTISNTILLQGNCVIDGNGKTLILEDGGALFIDSNSFISFRNLYVKGILADNIKCVDDSAKIQFDDVTCDFSGSTTFAAGSILITNRVDFIGSYTLYYSSLQTSTIGASSDWIFRNGMTLSIGRQQDTNVQPLVFVDNSSYLKFSDSDWLVTATGMQITNGNVVFDRQVQIDIQGTSTTYGLILGTGNQIDDATFQLNSGASMRFGSGYFTYNNAQSNLIQASSVNASLIRSVNSRMALYNNLALPSITIITESALTPAIEANGFFLDLNNSRIKFPTLELDITGRSLANTMIIMDGDGDSLSFSKGVLPIPVILSGPQNSFSGNGSISGPIIFNDSSTTLISALNGSIFNSVLLNGGNLILNADLELGASAQITGTGSINLTAFALDLTGPSLVWTSTLLMQGANGIINLNNSLSLLSTWTVNGMVTINGNNNIFDFGPHSHIAIAPNSQLRFKNIILSNISTSKISCLDDTSIISLNNVTWIQNGDFEFSTGRMNFVNNVDISGTYSFVYESSQTSTINQNSQLYVHSGIDFVLGKQSIDSVVQPLAFVDRTSLMKLEDCMLSVNPNGLQLTRGTIATVRNVTVDINSTSTADGLVLGDGTVNNDLEFNLYPGSTIVFPNGHLTFNLTALNLIRAMSESAKLIREADSVFYLAESLILRNFTIQVNSATPLMTAPGKSLTYESVTYQTPLGTLSVTGEQLASSILFFNGGDNAFVLAGAIPFILSVSNAGNIVGGSGSTYYPTILQDSNAQLIWGMTGLLGSNMIMNGGMLALISDLTCASDVLLSGSGTVVLNNHNFNLGINDLTWTDPITWNGTNGAINLNADLTLSSTWVISGACTINGNNEHHINMATGNIIVAPNSVLRLKNISVNNVADHNIQCADDSASIILESVNWIQSADYIFDTGALQVKNNTILKGKNLLFVYETIQTSTILANSQLTLDQGLTFSYYPQDGISNNLLQYVDSTSFLRLNNASLYTGLMGLSLTKGSFIVNRNSVISSDVQDDTDNGFTFGDETNGNDLTVVILQGSQLSLIQGSINYKNLNLSSWTNTNVGSNLYLGNATSLNLYQSIDVGPGTIQFDNATLGRTETSEIFGGISVVGGIAYVTL